MKLNTGLGIQRTFENSVNRIKTNLKHDKTKIFGIGANKTGTTSLKAAMKELGFVVGNQRTAELLFDDWAGRDFKRIIKYCHTAQFFQDVPFSLPDTYKVLDKNFPNSKFILTVRDTPEQWYKSLTSFHSKLWGKDGRIPTKKDLQNATYIYKGRPWHTNRKVFMTPEDDPYNREILIDFYTSYISEVTQYFINRTNDLLILNVSQKKAYKKLADFVGKNTVREEFPWKNKT